LHTFPTQLWLAQSSGIEHVSPAASRHGIDIGSVPSHVIAPVHMPSSWNCLTGAQIPSEPFVSAAVHASQSEPQAPLQQKPSAQKPLWHSIARVHVSPITLRHTIAIGSQYALRQSAPTRHVLPVSHGSQPPPQSTSVSIPFCTMSLHVGAWHIPPVHTPLAQSPAIRHIWPGAQSAMHEPPQSISVSVPFFTMSLHVGG
jgi:hypothetical protein